MGSLRISVSFDGGTFWVLPFNLLSRSARIYHFPQSVKIHYFRSGPISVDPIRSATKASTLHTAMAWCDGWSSMETFRTFYEGPGGSGGSGGATYLTLVITCLTLVFC